MIDDGRFEMLELLGEGGFGAVYRARFHGEGSFAKEVALKVLHPDMEEVAEVAVRLRDEARVLGLLRHRAIVQVDRLTRLGGRWAVVMEYVEGVDLAHLVTFGPTPLGAALEMVAEVAGALHTAYSSPGPTGEPLRLLHRDIKPANIRLTPQGGVKVLDFGISRAEFTAREATTGVIAFGSAGYMSPERLDMSDEGPAGDVYGLGVVLHEMLTGRLFGRTSANPTKHAKKVREALDALPDLAAPMRTMLGSALAFDPSERLSAEALELEALSYSRQLGQEPLRRWSHRMIPTIRAANSALDNAVSTTANLTGLLLREDEETIGGTQWEAVAPPTPPAAGPRERPLPLQPAHTLAIIAEPKALVPPGPAKAPAVTKPQDDSFPIVVWAGIGAGLLAVVAVVAVVAGWALSPGPSSPPRREPVVSVEPNPPDAAGAQPATAPADTKPASPEEPVGVTAPHETAPSAGSGTVSADTVSAPETSTPAPTPAVSKSASTPPPSFAEVRVTGEASTVVLVSGKGKYSVPGRVPIGRYEIKATFPGDPEVVVGSITLTRGDKPTLRCTAFNQMCKLVQQ